MPLSSVDFLMRVNSTRPTDLRSLHRLTVDDDHAGSRFSARCHTDLLTQHLLDLIPSAILAPLAVIVMHRTLGWQVMWQITPLASSAIDVKDGIYHLAHICVLGARPSPVFGRGNRGFQDSP